MAFTLTLTGASVGTLNLNDMTPVSGSHLYSIMVQGWQPRVARRRTGQIGGVPYEDVEETLPLAIVGHTRAAVLDALSDLAVALDEASRWRLSAYGMGPILLNWLPEGSSLGAAVSAAVLGPGDGDDLLSLQPHFNKDLQGFFVECEIKLIRRGQWLGAEETKTGSAVDLPGLLTATTLTALDIASPEYMKLVFSNMATSPSRYTFLRGFLFFSDLANTLELVDVATNITNWDTVAEAGAAGGNIIRSKLTSSSFTTIDLRSLSIVQTGRYAIAAMLRNRSSVLTYSARVRFDPVVGASIYSRWVTIPPGSGEIEPVFIGTVDVEIGWGGQLYIEFEPSAAITAGHELDLDTAAVISMHDNTQIMSVYGVGGSDFVMSIFNDGYLEIDHNMLTDYSPSVSLLYAAAVPDGYGAWAGRSGDSYLQGKGTTAYTLAFLHSEAKWQVFDSNNVHVKGTLTCKRRPGYVVVK